MIRVFGFYKIRKVNLVSMKDKIYLDVVKFSCNLMTKLYEIGTDIRVKVGICKISNIKV